MPYALSNEINNRRLLTEKPGRTWGHGVEYITSGFVADPSVWNPEEVKRQQFQNAQCQRIALVMKTFKPVSPMLVVGTHYLYEQYLKERLVYFWPELGSPFTQTGLLNTEEQQLHDLLLRFKTSPLMSASFREKLISRLFDLIQDAQEEDNAVLGINIGSLRGFYNFIHLNKGLRFPDISLTPDNNIYATWKDDNKRVFSVHFLSGGDVRFVILKPNEKHAEKQIRTTGSLSVDILMDLLQPYDLEEWVME